MTMREAQIMAVAKVIRARCCRKADGNQLKEFEAMEIAIEILDDALGETALPAEKET